MNWRRIFLMIHIFIMVHLCPLETRVYDDVTVLTLLSHWHFRHLVRCLIMFTKIIRLYLNFLNKTNVYVFNNYVFTIMKKISTVWLSFNVHFEVLPQQLIHWALSNNIDSCSYFPVRLYKTVDLDPQYNYLFGFHPHGVIVCGGFINFCTEATGFSKLFPGITPHLLSLSGFFQYPFAREYLLSSGKFQLVTWNIIRLSLLFCCCW